MPRPTFECADCHREVFVLHGIISDDKRCAACLMLPGWTESPELAHLLDPANAIDVSACKEPTR